jgi:hypothetical protein
VEPLGFRHQLNDRTVKNRDVKVIASSCGARHGTTERTTSQVDIHLPSSPSVSSSCTTAAPANPCQRGGMGRLGDLIRQDSRVSSIADRHGTDRLQPLRTWSYIACQSVFSPIGNESQPTDGPISTSPMPTSCIAPRTPGPLVVGGICASAQHGRDSCRLRTHWVWPNSQ